MIILGYALALIYALYDYKKNFVDHTSRYIIRIVIILLLSFLGAESFWNYVLNFFSITSVFYLVFDYVINILDKQKWNYIGTTSEIDKFWNRTFGNSAWKIQLFFKIFFVILVHSYYFYSIFVLLFN